MPSLTWSVLQPSSAAPPARGGHSVRLQHWHLLSCRLLRGLTVAALLMLTALLHPRLISVVQLPLQHALFQHVQAANHEEHIARP